MRPLDEITRLRDNFKNYRKICHQILEGNNVPGENDLRDELMESVGQWESIIERALDGKVYMKISGLTFPVFETALSSDFKSIAKFESLEMAIQALNKVVGALKSGKITLDEVQRQPDYPVNFNDHRLSKLDANERRVFEEAVRAYTHEAFTPAVMACRTVLQSLVDKALKTHGLKVKEPGMGSKIRELEREDIITGHHKELTAIAKFFGDESAHRVSQIFDQPKANIVISSILILLDEVF